MILFFFNDTATTEIYTLSLHDALPIFPGPFLREARSGSGFLDYVAKRDEFTIHAHIGEPFLSLQRLKPANVPRPYRRRAACSATGRVLVQIALQEDQRFRFAAE